MAFIGGELLSVKLWWCCQTPSKECYCVDPVNEILHKCHADVRGTRFVPYKTDINSVRTREWISNGGGQVIGLESQPNSLHTKETESKTDSNFILDMHYTYVLLCQVPKKVSLAPYLWSIWLDVVYHSELYWC